MSADKDKNMTAAEEYTIKFIPPPPAGNTVKIRCDFPAGGGITVCWRFQLCGLCIVYEP